VRLRLFTLPSCAGAVPILFGADSPGRPTRDSQDARAHTARWEHMTWHTADIPVRPRCVPVRRDMPVSQVESDRVLAQKRMPVRSWVQLLTCD
jgi:hypothetical protein